MEQAVMDAPVAKQALGRRLQVLRLPSETALEPSVWARIVPFFRAALEYCHGELSESAIKALVGHDKQQVWISLAGDNSELVGAMLTEVTEYPCLRVLRIVLLQGIAFKNWSGQARVALEEYAREMKCERLEASGRKGLTRLLAPLGFEPAYTTLIMEVRPNGQKRRL